LTKRGEDDIFIITAAEQYGTLFENKGKERKNK